jgi:multisubunit Na+/H+ antiporter MnhB subunit
MMALEWILDGLLALLLVGLVARIMFTRNLFEAVVLFIAFGLSLSLAWVRLDAPDVALAEAALGAGVTGALFLNAYHRLARRREEAGMDVPSPTTSQPSPESRGSRQRPHQGDDSAPLLRRIGRVPWVRWGLAVATALLATGLAGLLLGLPDRAPILPALISDHLDETGVSNPITGVLLSFRAYDTLMELGVLVVAMVAVWSLDRGSREFARHGDELRRQPVLDTLAWNVTPMAVVTGIYLVWAGSYTTGGAFQAGALLAGVGVLLAAAGLIRPVTSASPGIRILGILGLALFTAVGLTTMPWTGVFLAYPPGTEYLLILLIEVALTVSIAVILVELFVDVPAIPETDPELEQIHPTGDPLGRGLAPDGALIRKAGEDE